jgi:hypothetical protein
MNTVRSLLEKTARVKLSALLSRVNEAADVVCDPPHRAAGGNAQQGGR